MDFFLNGWSATDGAIPAASRAAYHHAFARREGIRGSARTTEPERPSTSNTIAPTAPPDAASPRRSTFSGRNPAAPRHRSTRSLSGVAWADDVTGHGLDAGHFLPEERPDEVATALRDLIHRR